MKSFDDFRAETQEQFTSLKETIKFERPHTGNYEKDIAYIIGEVFRLANELSDARLRTYHEWLSKQLSADE